MTATAPETDDGGTLRRNPVEIDVAAAVDLVHDGMTIAIGGFINSDHPMVVVREIIRRGIKDLVVVGAASSGLELDMLIGAGCARKVISPYIGAEGLVGIGPAFRHYAQSGMLEVFELDEAHHYAGLRAAAQGLPFNPWRAGVGTSLPVVNPALKEFDDPVDGSRLIAVPAIEIDVAFLHAARSDRYGNVQHAGTGFGDRAIHAASERTVVQVESIVAPEQIRARPQDTSVAGALVIRTPYGSHPFGAQGAYPPDEDHLREYIAAAGDLVKTGSRQALDQYFATYIHEPQTHAEYLEAIGFERLLSLREF